MAALPPGRAESLRAPLLDWYRDNRRDLPWRGSPTPYQVWVSEVMLQQTRVEVVRGYYARWMARFPTVESLAHAEEEEVLHLWQGLGYYSRARRLLEGARFLVRERGAILPSSPAALLEVPGVGPYSAGAIASIAHGVRAPLVDGNVIRVLTRVLGLGGDPAKAPLKNDLWRVADELVPEEAPGEFNQALMELGALVCTPKSPSCTGCPWQKLCVARAQGAPERYPEKPAARAATETRVLVLVLSHRGNVAFERLPEGARWWAGLTALPSIELTDVTGGALSSFWQGVRAGLASTERGFASTEPRDPAGETMRRGLGGTSGRARSDRAARAAAETSDESGASPRRRAASKATEGAPGEEEAALRLAEELVRARGGTLDTRRARGGLALLPLERHQVTRFKITLVPVRVELTGARPQLPGHEWIPAEGWGGLALPAPHRRLVRGL